MLGFDIYSANSISARHFYRHSIEKKADHDLAYKQGIRQVQSIKQVQGQSIKQVQGLATIPPCFMFLKAQNSAQNMLMYLGCIAYTETFTSRQFDKIKHKTYSE